MGEVSEARVDAIAEKAAATPEDVSQSELEELLAGLGRVDEYSVQRTAGEALETLTEELPSAEVARLVDAEVIEAVFGTIDGSAGGRSGFGALLSAVCEEEPDLVRSFSREIGHAVGDDVRENTAKEILGSVLDADGLADAASAFCNADSAGSRNLGVRLLEDLAGRGYDVEEAEPEAVEPYVPDLWDRAETARESYQVRKNAVDALAEYADSFPEQFTDSVDRVAAMLQTTGPRVRSDLLDFLAVIAEHDPAAVEPAVSQVRTEFNDTTGTPSTRSSTIEVVAALADEYPAAGRPVGPFLARIEDDGVRFDGDSARVVAAAGAPEHVTALLAAGEFDTESIRRLYDRADEDGAATVREILERQSRAGSPHVRYRALRTIVNELHGEFEDPASLYLEALDDDAENEENYESVRDTAADGLAVTAREDPERLTGSTARLFDELESAVLDDDARHDHKLGTVLGRLARHDDDIYAAVVEALERDDRAANAAALEVLHRPPVAGQYPDAFDDPVPELLRFVPDSASDSQRDLSADAVRALSPLASVRPETVEAAVDPVVERIAESENPSSFAHVLAGLAAEYPDELVSVLDRVADSYADSYTGDYRFDNTGDALVLAFLALEHPETVSDAIAPLVGRERDRQPPSLPLVRLAAGADVESVPDEWAAPESDEGLAALLLDPRTEQKQFLTTRLLGSIAYEPATPLLEAVVAEEAQSQRVERAAAAALDS
ncbi:hypothetical protein DVK02_05940 [Halobellus sp. Atlit-31R]|nr:hypothetical protein DVK02_05940 [Halobellus sp. Atlit-31R]